MTNSPRNRDPELVNAAVGSPREISGRWVVIGMFTFGISATAVLWIYSYYNSAPFQPLQRALAAEFEDSSPRVKGGQRKIHQGTPRVLHIVLRVDFNPNTDSARVESMFERVVQIARQHVELSSYDQFELHLFRQVPERKSQHVTIQREIAALLDSVPDTNENKDVPL